MQGHFSASEKVGDIVAKMPKAAEVFKQHRIDFCCGGDKPLSEAIGDKSISEDEILNKLEDAWQATEKLKDKGMDWRHTSMTELVDYIVDKHHGFLQRELPQIGELATMILRAHGANHEELNRVHRLVHNLKTELEQHMIQEEEILFPLVRDYEREGSLMSLSRAINLIDKLENEHDTAGGILHELRDLTNDYSVPKDACPTYCKAYEKLIELEGDLFEHIHLENNILHRRLIEAEQNPTPKH